MSRSTWAAWKSPPRYISFARCKADWTRARLISAFFPETACPPPCGLAPPDRENGPVAYPVVPASSQLDSASSATVRGMTFLVRLRPALPRPARLTSALDTMASLSPFLGPSITKETPAWTEKTLGKATANVLSVQRNPVPVPAPLIHPGRSRLQAPGASYAPCVLMK
jgi:hypothetical protein